jgi:hypothetical protein
MLSDVYDIYDTQIEKLTRHKILWGWKCCTYEGGLLADGTIDAYEVKCPWHGPKFDVRTSEVTNHYDHK